MQQTLTPKDSASNTNTKIQCIKHQKQSNTLPFPFQNFNLRHVLLPLYVQRTFLVDSNPTFCLPVEFLEGLSRFARCLLSWHSSVVSCRVVSCRVVSCPYICFLFGLFPCFYCSSPNCSLSLSHHYIDATSWRPLFLSQASIRQNW